ncbi:MAG: HD domain-containing protein [Spirochaetaceae bacterium]|nr:HD domain-containing protein [Spirochaetaceae bacterium]
MSTNRVSLKQVRKLDERIFPELLKRNCTLSCQNGKSQKNKRISINALYDNNRGFWLNDSTDWSYFVPLEMIESIVEDLKLKDLEREKRLTINEAHIEYIMNREYSTLVKVGREDRIHALSGALNQINRVINSRGVSLKEKTDVLLEVSSYSYLVNKITLDEVAELTDEDAGKVTMKLARLTEKIINSMTKVLNEDIKENTFLLSLVEKSNGVTLRHMVRTFILSYRFVLFFNHEITKNSLASHMRAKFNESFRHWYSSLLPHIPLEDLTLENVFKGGMRAIPEKDLNVYSAGFLLHDIGKQRYIDYYEGDEDYDSRKVEAHAKTGHRMLLQKRVYSEEIAAIAGYHHEYYGHESGYGYYRELCSLVNLDKKYLRQDSCISYNLKDLHRFSTLSFLPAKFLEIVDVYDAITDPGRSYKSHLDAFDALKFMREEFIVRNKKIDPILFELFVRFLQKD